MTTSVKQQFIAELEPLLDAAEQAIAAGNPGKSRWLSLSMLKLVRDYRDKLDPAELRDALNNPKAKAVAKRLGVEP